MVRAGLLFVHASSATPSIQYGPTVLSGTATNAKEPAVSTSANGQYVYVAWTEGGEGIYFAVSSNGGSSFSTPLKISTVKGTAAFPVMITGDGYQSANSGDVYVAWSQTVSRVLQIFVAASTNNGTSFVTTQVSCLPGELLLRSQLRARTSTLPGIKIHRVRKLLLTRLRTSTEQ